MEKEQCERRIFLHLERILFHLRKFLVFFRLARVTHVPEMMGYPSANDDTVVDSMLYSASLTADLLTSAALPNIEFCDIDLWRRVVPETPIDDQNNKRFGSAKTHQILHSALHLLILLRITIRVKIGRNLCRWVYVYSNWLGACTRIVRYSV